LVSGEAVRMDLTDLENKRLALRAAIRFFMIFSVNAHKKGNYRLAAEKLEKARENIRKLKELEEHG